MAALPFTKKEGKKIFFLIRTDDRAMNNSRTLPFLPPEEPAPLPSQAKSKSGSDRMK